MTYTIKGFGIVSKAEIDVFLELSCFFHDPADVGNVISGSSAFSKTSLNIRASKTQSLLRAEKRCLLGAKCYDYFMVGVITDRFFLRDS